MFVCVCVCVRACMCVVRFGEEKQVMKLLIVPESTYLSYHHV